MIELVNPPELGQPKGFSHAVVGTGRTVFLAGQTALNPDGVIVGDTVVEQFEQALSNLLVSLRAAGGEPTDLATLTIYLVDIDDYKAHGREIGRVWKKLLGSHYPATAGIGVARLWDVEALVEVQGMAVIEAREGSDG
ncbi:RidA family protein [Ornithinimicrobium sufpigmenti]|uniref:RidA family protein n=1 Tax=Ornithinimicrobium sufpigmenti TaxID=2508882 RepID=UPI0010369938|nr:MULTISPECIES: RidA family protein [unclassified Ornithinimicrobium]